MKTTHTYYEVAISNGSYCTDRKDNIEDAIIYAKAEKNQSNNPNMSEENKAYWAKQTYTVRKVTIITEELVAF